MATKATTTKAVATKADATRAKGIIAISAKSLADVKAAFSENGPARVIVVRDLLAAGYSQSAMIAAATKANRGIPVSGFSKGAVGRAAIVAAQSSRDDLPRVTAAQGVAAIEALCTLANYGTAPEVVAAHDLAIKGAKTGAAYVAALNAAVRETGRGLIAAARTKGIDATKARGTKGPKAGRTKGTTAREDAAAVAADSLAAAGLSALVERIAEKVAALDAIDAATADALADLAAILDAKVAAFHGVDVDA